MTYDETAPPVVCKAWCGKGEGHVDEHPDERDCWSKFIEFLIRHGEPDYTVTRGLRLDVLNVYLRQREGMETPLIRLFTEGLDKVILRLTVPEAAQLREALDEMLALAGDEHLRLVEAHS